MDEDMPRTRKNIIEFAKKVGFHEVDVGDVEELLNSHKEQLSTSAEEGTSGGGGGGGNSEGRSWSRNVLLS
jgi:hypothetical protein